MGVSGGREGGAAAPAAKEEAKEQASAEGSGPPAAAGVEARGRVGHREADAVTGSGSKDCAVTLVERKTGLVLVGKLRARTAEPLSRRVARLIRGVGRVERVTGDNGAESHDDARVERLTGAALLLRAAVSSVGERRQRERQRSAAPVPAEGGGHGRPESASM